MNNKSIVDIQNSVSLIKGRPDLTPMVDVLFLLLIFFMLSSSFVQVSGVEVDLPETSVRGTRGVKKFIITVDKQSKLWFNDFPQTFESLKEELQRVSSDSLKISDTIVIRADKDASFGIVATIMAVAEEANLNAFIAINSVDDAALPKLEDIEDNE